MEAELPRLPAQIVRVQRDAVPAQTGAGIEGLKAVGLGLGRLDDLPDVDAHAVAQNRQLVDQADVDVAVGIFEDFFHLGHGGAAHAVHGRLQHRLVKRGGDIGAFGGDAAHHLGGVLGFIDGVAGVHALRRKGQEKVHAALEAALFQNGAQHFLGGAGVGGGFQNDEHIAVHMGHDAFRGGAHVADIGLLMLVKRRRHGDAHAVARGHGGKVRRGAKHTLLHDLFEVAVHHVADVVVALIDHVHLPGLHVKADHMEAGLGLFHRQREPDIAQSNHAQGDGTVENLLLQNRHAFNLLACV